MCFFVVSVVAFHCCDDLEANALVEAYRLVVRDSDLQVDFGASFEFQRFNCVSDEGVA